MWFPFSKCKHFRQHVCFFYRSLPAFQWTTKKLHRVSDWFYNEIIILAWSRCGSHFPGHKLQYRTEGPDRTHLNSSGSLRNLLHSPVPHGGRCCEVTDYYWKTIPCLQDQLFGEFLGMWEKEKYKIWMSFFFFFPDSMVISLLIITKKKHSDAKINVQFAF